MNALSKSLGSIHPSLESLQGVPLYIFLLVALLGLLFLLGYAVKGTQVWWELSQVVKAVAAHRADTAPPSPESVGQAFKSEPLKHLWDEYADTLHEIRKGGSGAASVSEVRATVPAETMFTREVLVDSRLFDDFARHLPGVLTGLGIIGTFAGLLDGLRQFQPTPIEAAVKGLGPLLTGVQHAFVASGFAIACAMVVVFISRLTLAYLYRLVERLTQTIDGLYATGAGEEYLARLVKSSEQNAASSAQLKDALVEDLRQMMTNLVERQIASHEAATVSLGKHIGESISTAIAEPMKRVGEAMEATTRGNGEQVSSILETLLTGFMAKLEDTFGSQMRSINEQMQRSMDSMAAVQGSLQGLLADIKRTNEHAASQMSGTLEEAMKKAADNQQVLTDQMREFVQDFRRLVSEEANKSKQAMDDAISTVLGQIGTAMEGLEAARKTSAAEESGRHQQLATQTNQLVGGLTAQVESLLASVSEQVTKAQQNIDALSNVSLRAINDMNQGALTMGSAAQRFETAGSAVTTVLDRSSSLTDSLSSASTALQTAASAVQRGFEQYDSTRRTVDTHIAKLEGLIKSAQSEAGVSEQLVASIKSSADAMRAAEAASRAHLTQINDALTDAFEKFGTALVGQVQATIAETDRHLSKGTGHLNGVVQELANAVHRMKRT
ncbi:hypothetical protein LMG23992_02273 [Cupriavidus laharis]|uniref:Methyl-accepting chemotaxis protein n=1 Tax=Cupriavidus laharis TaxID=151654 RepID=A0ABN7YGK6_9BURK|nr:anti-phage ZorAB system protein ZorA [Cupriavidus laharis]CAG9172584.1 hypothetical protein LMG23992_02273 [Cupriavidus laharis]